MQTTALADGDPRWVFPELEDTCEVFELLRRADDEIRSLADHFVSPTSWTGGGIAFVGSDEGRASLCGCVRADRVTFLAQLWYPRYHDWDAMVGPPWGVQASISVQCDGRVDCGWHPVEATPRREVDLPMAAAIALLEDARWLRRRAAAESLDNWRRPDLACGFD
jgi:hypothetical protein